jgi:glycosyltransferase involved in cell wall biosynthesis
MDLLVSIITPSYNQGQYLEATIQSVLGQAYKNIEYIVIDGGSTDNSIEVIKKYDKSISHWISEKDSGQADALNKGFAQAKGDFICWVNSDDLLYSHFISDRMKQFSDHPDISMIYGDVHQGWDLNSKTLRKGSQQNWKEMITTGKVNIPQMSAIWKKDVLSSLGGLDVSFTVLLDWEYFVRIAKAFRILYIPGAVAFFRQHKDSKSVNLISSWAEEMIQYYEKNIFCIQYKKLINIKHTRQNLFLSCSALYEEVEKKNESTKYLKIAKTVSPIRFYRISAFKKLITLLVTIKKKMKI